MSIKDWVHKTIANKRKRALLARGPVVVKFDRRGCMASDHRLQWIGVVIGFKPTRLAGEAVEVKILKWGDIPSDVRDSYQGIQEVPWTDTCLQEMTPNCFFLFK